MKKNGKNNSLLVIFNQSSIIIKIKELNKNMLNKILKVLMYGTVFLMPVFFFLYFEVLEFNKLYLSFFFGVAFCTRLAIKDDSQR